MPKSVSLKTAGTTIVWSSTMNLVLYNESIV